MISLQDFVSNRKALLHVGICASEELHFSLVGDYILAGNVAGCGPLTRRMASGDYCARLSNGNILFQDVEYLDIRFIPSNSSMHGCKECSFTLKQVKIGIGFHWEQLRDETFMGVLHLIREDNCVRAVNEIYIEDYLQSVISSEMSPSATDEYLKAHTVLSRSWVLSQIIGNSGRNGAELSHEKCYEDCDQDILWWDREDHVLFDVCADDHCQRYQGISQIGENWERTKAALEATKGEVLMYENEVCDARFSKCCGGVTEKFSSCWQNVDYPYLQSFKDECNNNVLFNIKSVIRTNNNVTTADIKLDNEVMARQWINDSPACFCNTKEPKILSQVLNDYDSKTQDFFRWRVRYTRKELSAIIKKRTGYDFGEVLHLVPLERGDSGRIVRLKIVGSKLTKVIGKELYVRKALSESHLFSSAFVVNESENGFELIGAGWGHGVGLCQIGAAVMAYKGYSYKEILLHYFKGASIEKIY